MSLIMESNTMAFKPAGMNEAAPDGARGIKDEGLKSCHAAAGLQARQYRRQRGERLMIAADQTQDRQRRGERTGTS